MNETVTDAEVVESKAVVLATPATPAPAQLTVDEVMEQIKMVDALMKKAMKKDEHYGVIPGCGSKPTLLKPGAEKLSQLFRLAPTYDIRRTDFDNGHREYEIICTLTNIGTGAFVGQGVGLCSTMESKYRYRGDAYNVIDDEIPDDYKERKTQYRKEGFGCKKIDGAWAWVEFTGEKEENPNIADTYNTVLKIGKKRSHVDAVLTATAASDIFTQDVEDMDRDKGNDKGKAPDPTPEPDKFITREQRDKMFSVAEDCSVEEDDLIKIVHDITGQESSKGILATDFDAVIKKIQDKDPLPFGGE